MADDPGRRSYRTTHRVSRQTMVLRKAKEEDARRLAERDAEAAQSLGAVYSMDEAPEDSPFAAGRSACLVERGTTVTPRRDRSLSGRTIVVKDSSSLSGRLSSRRLTGAESVRLAGGDSIVRYASGDMVVHRGARRAGLQKQAIILYAAGYLLLFGLYAFFLFTGTTSIEPAEFVARSFARREGSGLADLEQAAYAAMRGSRTPAEIRVAEPLSFYDGNGDTVRVEEGTRLTLPVAVRLAQAIIADGEKAPALRSFTEPIAIYRETYLSGVDWPVWLSLYNAFGFFLLLALFLWRPLMHYLGTQGQKTAVALRNARDAVLESEEYKKKYRELSAEVAARAQNLRVTAEKRLEKEKAEALEDARRRAEEISGGVRSALAGEETELAARIGRDAAHEACDRALELVRARAGKREHDRAVDDLVRDIEGMRFSR